VILSVKPSNFVSKTPGFLGGEGVGVLENPGI